MMMGAVFRVRARARGVSSAGDRSVRPIRATFIISSSRVNGMQSNAQNSCRRLCATYSIDFLNSLLLSVMLSIVRSHADREY